DDTGTLWTVPNGTVMRIGNRSRDWSEGSVDVTVSDAKQLDDAIGVIEQVADDVSVQPDVADVLLRPITALGVQSIDGNDAVVRVIVRTTPGDHARVMRTLRAELA